MCKAKPADRCKIEDVVTGLKNIYKMSIMTESVAFWIKIWNVYDWIIRILSLTI